MVFLKSEELIMKSNKTIILSTAVAAIFWLAMRPAVALRGGDGSSMDSPQLIDFSVGNQ